MSILRIEHSVKDFGQWKQAFDSDPAGRERSGVRRYQVMRPVDDPNFVMIDLEFETPEAAEALLASMRVLWQGVAATIISNPTARIVETVEAREY
ncbi:MAG: hypothetical protein WD770_01435 [Actinomycetota bacterium]